MAAHIGMMDSAYFVGRAELLQWINTTLSLNVNKVEETANGAVACQLMDVIHPNLVNMGKARPVFAYNRSPQPRRSPGEMGFPLDPRGSSELRVGGRVVDKTSVGMQGCLMSETMGVCSTAVWLDRLAFDGSRSDTC
jgi:hypothetical protein